MTIHARKEGDELIVMGQTYPHKEAIKALGARFVPGRKVWSVVYSEENKEAVTSLCQSLGGSYLGEKESETEHIPTAARSFQSNLKIPESTSNPPAEMFSGTPIPKAEGLTVSQLIQSADQAIRQAFSRPIWVIGEIQNLSHKGNSIYLYLAEGVEGASQAQTKTVSAAIWPRALSHIRQKVGKGKLEEILDDGIKIRCLCSVSLYQGRASLSLSIEDVDLSFTKGALALAREALLKELRMKGLDQKNKRLPLPKFPFTIGLISAKGSRAESDFLHQLETGGFPGEVLFYPASMQGEKVETDVVKAFKTLEKKDVDLIVLTRGGGSAADLRWFDSKVLAYAIAELKTPLIAAIGHHDDQSVAEEIAYARCKTPTAAADFVVERFLEAREDINELATSIARVLESLVETLYYRQSALLEKLTSTALLSVESKREETTHLFHQLERVALRPIQELERRVHQLGHSLGFASSSLFADAQERIGELERSLIRLDPTPWMKRGWTQLFTDNKKGLTEIKNLKLGERLKARLLDGVLDLEVKDITLKEPKNHG